VSHPFFSAACLALSANTAIAQNARHSRGKPQPSKLQFRKEPACVGSPYRDFDFWIGTWEAVPDDGTLARPTGSTPEEADAFCVELGTSANGGTAKAIIFGRRDTEDCDKAGSPRGQRSIILAGWDADVP